MNQTESSSYDIPFKNILIYGMGMMGSSLAWAVKNHPNFFGRVDGVVRSRKSADVIESYGITDNIFVAADRYLTKQSFNQYDLIVIALPVIASVELLAGFPDYQGIVTDMSSTRRVIHRVSIRRPELRFIGSHPMCGSEDQGPQAMKQNLFMNRLAILSRNADIDSDTFYRKDEQNYFAQNEDEKHVEQFWRSIGMKTFWLTPRLHDEILAYLSHAPHFISGLLARWAWDSSSVTSSIGLSPVPITGGGFRDMVRIAGSNPEMWADIFETNGEFIVSALRNFINDLERLTDLLEKGDRDKIKEWIVKAREDRDRLCGFS